SSRSTSKQPTREPSPVRSESYFEEDEGPEPLEPPETPKASEKGKAPNIQIQNPTPSHAGQEDDWEDDEYDKNEAIRVINDMHRELTAMHQLWNPKSRGYP